MDYLPQSVKNVGDVTAGTVLTASWFDWIQGPLEFTALVLAVVYGAARLYDTKLYRDIVQWLKTWKKS